MINAFSITIYILGLIIGYIFIIYLQANDKLGYWNQGKNIAVIILLLWPAAIPLLIAGLIVISLLFLMANLFEKLEDKLLQFFRKRK